MPATDEIRIAVLDDYQRVAADHADWDALPGEVTFFHDHVTDRDALVRRLRPFTIVAAMRERTPFDAALLARLPDLACLVTTGRRNAAIDVEAAARHGITVCGTQSPGHATAELTFALILGLARGLHEEVASVRAGGWQVGVGRDLAGATLGVVGLGRLGARVAAMGQAFGMEVVAWSQNLTDARAAEVGVRRVSRDELLAAADVVTVHVRLSDRTTGLLGAGELARMKPDAFLVNTSRGPVVDTDALVAALRAGRLAGAAVDVFDTEPLPAGSPLRSAPRLLATPHIGYVTRETYEVFYRQTVQAIEAYLAGAPIRVIEPRP